ncbi:MAG: hypothetical protein ABJF79_01385 [Paracoccaceae bacterium]
MFQAGLEAEIAGDLEAAVRALETCTLAGKRDLIADRNLDNVQHNLGQLTYERAIEKDVSCTEAHFNLADVLVRMGRPDETVTHLRETTEIDAPYPDSSF